MGQLRTGGDAPRRAVHRRPGRVGVSPEQFLDTEPYLSTKLLSGCFSYLLDHEGPLGVVAVLPTSWST
ncbi:hypothetical protein LT493_04830 [Streptomyces tricolor]|nr:hypothetical protein [Streptomyces tricolor]